MPIQVKTPDGGIAEFPDGTPREVIAGALRRKFPAPAPEANVAAKESMPVGRYGQAERGGLTDLALQGMSLNTSDEILAGLGAPVAAAGNLIRGQPANMGNEYTRLLEARRGDIEEARRDYPVLGPAAEVVGGLATGVGKGVVAAGLSPAMRVARGALEGAGYGAAAGAGAGTDLESRLRGAATGGAEGALIGGGLPATLQVGGALASRATAPLRAMARPGETAARKTAEAFDRDLMTPGRVEQRLAIAQTLKPETMVADIAGKNTADLLRAATNMPSKAGERLVRNIEGRQEGQLGRLKDDISTAFGNPDQFQQTTDSLIAARKQKAAPLWDQAYNTPTPYTKPLEDVLQRPLMQQILGRTRTAALNRGEDLSGFFAQEVQPGVFQVTRVPQTRDLHRMRMILNESIDSLKNRSESGLTNANLRDLAILKSDFDKAVDNPAYKQAIKEFADDSTPIGALKDGFEQGMRLEPEMIQKTLKDLSPADQEMWRLGFARDVVNRLRDTGRLGTNRADILASPKFQARLIAAFPDQAARRHFTYSLNLERRMARTRQAVQGNSTTAKQLAQGQEAAQDAQDAANVLTHAVTGNWSAIALGYLARARNAFSGLTPDVAGRIVDLLGSNDPAKLRAARFSIEQAEQRAKRLGGLGRGAIGLTTGLGVVGEEKAKRYLERATQ